MEENIRQLALISSVLGGFSFTFLSTILTTKLQKSKIEFWMLLFLMIASMSFLLTALGWSVVNFKSDPLELARHHQFLVKLLILGLIAIIVALGLGGWLKNKKVGIMTSVLGLLTLIILFSEILSRYISM